MSPLAPSTRRARGFTLIELLVVISAMAVLAGILIPVIRAVTNAARVANTESLLGRINLALANYMREQGLYPPDFVPSAQQYYHMHAKASPTDDHRFAVPGSALPPEALHYFVANPFVGAEAPYAHFRQGSETQDYNHNGLREVVDAWGYPLLYNRGKFPGRAATYYNFDGAANNYEDPGDNKPWHNKSRFDLYSVGPDGKTGGHANPVDPGRSLENFVRNAMRSTSTNNSCGTEPDDLNNWSQ